MITWGKGENSHVLGDLGERECAACGKTAPFQAMLHYVYRHIWYIFSWVTGRDYYAVCGNCGASMPMDKAEAKQMFPQDGISFLRKRGWILGLVLVVAIFSWAAMSNAEDQKNYQAYLAAPQVGDIYLARLSKIEGSGYPAGKSAYGAMFLSKVDGDRLVFGMSKTAYSKAKGVRKNMSSFMQKANYDWSDPMVLSTDKVKEMFEKNTIYRIIRN